jgi:hypothetical protein
MMAASAAAILNDIYFSNCFCCPSGVVNSDRTRKNSRCSYKFLTARVNQTLSMPALGLGL